MSRKISWNVPLIVCLTIFVAVVGHADQLLVTRSDDPSPGDCVVFPVPDCSLREAVLAANDLSGSDTIILPAGTFLLARSGAGEDSGLTGDLDVTDDIEIEGQSRLSTIINGGALDRVLHLADGASATLKDLTVRNGSVTGSGGGILAGTGSLSLTRVAVNNNSSSDRGGGLRSAGTLSLTSCRFLDNFAGNEGGGVFSGGPATVTSCEFDGNTGDYEGGGGWFSQGTAMVTRSTFTNNVGGEYGGGLGNSGSMTLVDCTIGANDVAGETGYGAGIHTWGPLEVHGCAIHENSSDGPAGGISVASAPVRISNSTLYENYGEFPAEILLMNGGSAELDHVTVYSSWGLVFDAETAQESFRFANTIVHGDCAAGLAVTSSGGNVESSGATCGFDHPTDLANVPPVDLDFAGGLTDNGGSTQTVALGPSSVAANRIQRDFGAADQRGLPRPLDGSWGDSGAYEREPAGSLVVTRFDDPVSASCVSWQSCSLREAVIAANTSPGENTVILSRGIYELELPGIGEDSSLAGDLDVTEAMEIVGFGPEETVIDGNGLDRVIDASGATTSLSLFQLGITGGSAIVGGAVEGSNLSLDRITVTGNHASLWGGGVYATGSIFLTDSLIEGNTAPEAAGLYAAGGPSYVKRSTFAANVADADGGGARFNGYASVENSTFSGNSAARGAGAFVSGSGSLINTTFAENSATDEAEALWVEDGATWTTFNTLFADTCGGSGAWATGWSSYGGNLESPTSTCSLASPDDRMGIAESQVLLQPLADNGGPTPTHALLPTSVAVDTGLEVGTLRGDPNNLCPSIDQRGQPRPDGAGCDVGAYEYQEGLIFASGFETGDLGEW